MPSAGAILLDSSGRRLLAGGGGRSLFKADGTTCGCSCASCCLGDPCFPDSVTVTFANVATKRPLTGQCTHANGQYFAHEIEDYQASPIAFFPPSIGPNGTFTLAKQVSSSSYLLGRNLTVASSPLRFTTYDRNYNDAYPTDGFQVSLLCLTLPGVWRIVQQYRVYYNSGTNVRVYRPFGGSATITPAMRAARSFTITNTEPDFADGTSTTYPFPNCNRGGTATVSW